MARDYPSDWVNHRQTPNARRLKYSTIRRHGYNSAWARSARDWCWSQVAKFLGYQSLEDLFLAKGINKKDALSFKDLEEE